MLRQGTSTNDPSLPLIAAELAEAPGYHSVEDVKGLGDREPGQKVCLIEKASNRHQKYHFHSSLEQEQTTSGC